LNPIRHEPTTPYGKGATKMSELSTATVEPSDVGQNVDQPRQEGVVVESAPNRAEALPPAPIFITEHEVVFSTGAETAPRPTRRWIEAVRTSYLEDSRPECEIHRQ
jgi:hypothetical protein